MVVHQVLAILYRGEEAARQEPRLLGTVENEVWLQVEGIGVALLIFYIAWSSSMARVPRP